MAMTSIQRTHRIGPAVLPLVLLWMTIAICGCTIGPQTVPRDRFNYGEALAKSVREELLTNIVRIRYLDSPMFLSVNSVVNQYSIESQISGGATWRWGSVPATGNDIGASSKFSDRPTITYAPVLGRQFAESYVKPITPEALVSFVESGWSVGRLFTLCVHSINGIDNEFYGAATRQDLDPRFMQIVDLMSTMQRDNTFSIRVVQKSVDEGPAFVILISGAQNPEQQSQITQLKEILGLDPDAERYSIVFGAAARDDTEIAMVTRSILAIVAAMSAYVEVPAQHTEDGRAAPGAPVDPAHPYPLTIRSSKSEPKDACVKIRHRETWFWIDDRDLRSKGVFLSLVLLVTVAEASDAAQTPLLTIPTG